MNLREQYLPYKKIIAEVLMDKTPNIRTVINKIDSVGDQNEYRTFSYEVLAGEDDMNVEVQELDCTYIFDYSKVYWNSRLETEHRRLVNKFQPGEAVCDVMAGVGPFAIPAAKKRCFVWANDLNPDSYASLENGVARNKVQLSRRKHSSHQTCLQWLGIIVRQNLQRGWSCFHPYRNKGPDGQRYACRYKSKEIPTEYPKAFQKSVTSLPDISKVFQSLRTEPSSFGYNVPFCIHWRVCRLLTPLRTSRVKETALGACTLLQ